MSDKLYNKLIGNTLFIRNDELQKYPSVSDRLANISGDCFTGHRNYFSCPGYDDPKCISVIAIYINDNINITEADVITDPNKYISSFLVTVLIPSKNNVVEIYDVCSSKN